MYVITMKNCAFFAHHGVLSEEERMGQRFYVDAKLSVIPSQPLELDSIEGTVDYGQAFQLIEKVITGERFCLIEALALQIAKQLLATFTQISVAEITVRKPSAPVRGVLDHVEVTVVQSAG